MDASVSGVVLTAMGFRRGVSCCTSVAADPYQLQKTDYFIHVLGKNFLLSPVVHVVAVSLLSLAKLLRETNAMEAQGCQKIGITPKLDLFFTLCATKNLKQFIQSIFCPGLL